MKLKLDRLEKVRQRGTKIIARCPACAEMDRDRAGDNLAIFDNGCFACSAYQQDGEHSRRILQLAGSDEPRQRREAHPTLLRLSPSMRRSQPVPQQALPADFADITREARFRVYESPELQERIAAEFGVLPKTIRCLSLTEGGAIGFFPSISIGGRPCLPDRIGYIYPQGIKIRHPWGPEARVRFAWACGSATEPWRFTRARARTWVRRYIITEGESDLIALVDGGVDDLTPEGGTAVVASPGTAFKEEWAGLFQGLNVLVAMDDDEAGAAAAKRTAELLRPHAARGQIFEPSTCHE